MSSAREASKRSALSARMSKEPSKPDPKVDGMTSFCGAALSLESQNESQKEKKHSHTRFYVEAFACVRDALKRPTEVGGGIPCPARSCALPRSRPLPSPFRRSSPAAILTRYIGQDMRTRRVPQAYRVNSALQRNGKNKYCRNFHFPYRLPGGDAEVVVTSVLGHVTSTDIAEPHRGNWHSCPPENLFDVPISTFVSDVSLCSIGRRIAWSGSIVHMTSPSRT